MHADSALQKGFSKPIFDETLKGISFQLGLFLCQILAFSSLLFFFFLWLKLFFFFFLKSEIFSYIVGKVYLITKEHIFLGGDFVLKLFGREISSF